MASACYQTDEILALCGDEPHLKEWLKVEEDPEAFKAFLQKNIFDCQDHYDYIELNGGIHKMNELRMKEHMLHREVGNG